MKFAACLAVASAVVSSALQLNPHNKDTAAVFVHPRGSAGHRCPSLHADESRLVLADRLGVSEYHVLGFQGQDKSVLELLHSEDQEKLFASRPEGHMVLLVHGVDDPETFLGDSVEDKPTFTITDSPSYDSFAELIDALARQLSHAREHIVAVFGPKVSIVAQKGHQLISDFEDLFEEKATSEDDFNDDITILESLTTQTSTESTLFDETVVVKLNGLQEIAEKTGTASDVYCKAKRQLAEAVKKLMKAQRDVPVSVVAVPRLSDKSVAGKVKREVSKTNSESPFGRSNEAPSVFLASAGCFTTKEACEEATNNCSSHGACVNLWAQKTCFTCSCIPTVETTKSGSTLTTRWAGADCSKVDISAPFNLLFWTGLILLLAVGAGIKFLYDMDSDELPGVLSAATTVKAKTHN